MTEPGRARPAPIWTFTLTRQALLLGAALVVGCVEKGDTTLVGADDAGIPATCNSICDRLQAATFGDCQKFEGYEDCVGECEDHRPLPEGLACMETVVNCDEVRACDSEFDIF